MKSSLREYKNRISNYSVSMWQMVYGSQVAACADRTATAQCPNTRVDWCGCNDITSVFNTEMRRKRLIPCS